jgi:hypothetical protein
VEVKLAEDFLEVRRIGGVVGACLVLEPDIEMELHPSHHVDWGEWVFRHLLFELC